MKKSERYVVNFGICGIAISLLTLISNAVPNKELVIIAAVFFLTISAIPFMMMVGENNRTKNIKGISAAIDRERPAFYASLLLIVPAFGIMLFKLIGASITLINLSISYH